VNRTDDRALVHVKRYPQGKMVYMLKGPRAYEEQALEALKTPGVCQVMPYVWEQGFAGKMRQLGVPEDAIDEFLRNATFDDEHCVMRETW
jgi:hypothetical protein